jgi:D-sedoheptulose 7-phosphate isomerase
MHCEDYLKEVIRIAAEIDPIQVEALATELAGTRTMRGKVYIIGIGGSAANAMHMAADLRKLCEIDAYSMDNIAELTARTNDEGFDTIFTGWLWNRIDEDDILLVLSVGGGTEKVSSAIVNAIKFAKERFAMVLGIVGPHGGYTAAHADHCLRIPAPSARITPHTEAFQAVLWHCLVSHPLLQKRSTKW